jgi:glycosyltransferase involved in cell wall biosynthesis
LYKKKNLIIYAPSVRSDGGKVILAEFFKAIPSNCGFTFFINNELVNLVEPFGLAHIEIVKPGIFNRLAAEIKLLSLTKKNDIVITFTNTPPVFPLKAHVINFHQNIILLHKSTIKIFPWFKEMKFMAQRLFSYVFRNNVNEFIVQSSNMERAIRNCYGQKTKVKIVPFACTQLSSLLSNNRQGFVYVAHGDEHKNHFRLLQAWSLLGKQGFKPKLILTISSGYKTLVSKINFLRENEGLEIYNVDSVNHEEIFQIYKNSEALIYPSLMESFALPLIEASQISLPIIASELDYVREVCEPIETFDPNSPISIMRAVRRFIKKPEPKIKIKSLDTLLKEFGFDKE